MTEPKSDASDGAVTLTPAPRAQQLRWLGVAAVMLVLIFGGLWWASHRAARPESQSAATAPDTFRATPQQLRTLSVESVRAHAFTTTEVTDGRIAVNADHATNVYSPFSGRIVALLAGPGDVVTAGRPLAIIESTEFVQAQNDFAAALAQARLTQASEARKRALHQEQGASLAEVEQAQADRATAVATLASAENRLRILGRSDADLARLRAGARLEARVPLAAPIAGVVVDRQAGPGQYLQAGSGTAVFTIANTATLWVVGDVPEADAARVKRGQAVDVRVAAWPDRLFTGHLNYVAVVIDPTTHRLAVRAELPNADGALKPEMLATLRIATSATTTGLAVPEGAVIYEGNLAHVWVVRGGDVIGLRNVRTGRAADGLVEIVAGLAPQEKVVTKGSLFIDRAARPD